MGFFSRIFGSKYIDKVSSPKATKNNSQPDNNIDTAFASNDIFAKQPSEEAGDVVPINGSAKFSFNLASLPFIDLPDWPPGNFNGFGWSEAVIEIRRHRSIIASKRIWSPHPILSYCLWSAEGPVPTEELSPMERSIREALKKEDDDGSKISIRYFLFPHKKPAEQSQAVAQVICETKLGAAAGDVRMWVDALREEELSEENIADIKAALKMLK